jgi:endoglucanase
LFGVESFGQQTFVQQHGQLSVKGTKIIDKNGNPVALRGMSLYWSQWQGQFWNANCITWLKNDWKCNVIRAAMAVQSGGYLTNPTTETAKVKTVVQACIDLGIYVIIDYHETSNGMDNFSKAQAFFDDMSRTYAQYPNIIYELWNEPLDTHPWLTVIKPYHEAVIPKIRANDTKNIIVCATRSWDQDVDEASKNPLDTSKYKNIAYTIHFYAATHKQSYRDKAQIALNNGIALFATEYGTTQATGPETMDTAETRNWYAFLDKNFISSCNWSVSALPEACAILPANPPGNYTQGGWAESSLKPSGKFVRSYLITANSATNIDPHDIRVLKTDVFSAKQSKTGVVFSFPNFTENTLNIFNLSGKRIQKLSPCGKVFYWNGTDNTGKKIPTGCYIAQLPVSGKSLTFKYVSLL